MRYFYEKGLFRVWFGSESLEISWPRLGLAFELWQGAERRYLSLHIHFLFLNFFIPFPIKASEGENDCGGRSWGFSFDSYGVHLNWGDKCKIFDYPWNWESVRHEVRRPDGSWAPYVGSYEKDKEPDGRELFKFPYAYTLQSGEVQKRTATVFVERSARRMRWLKWCTFFEKVEHHIDVTFDDEVGERTGSWKGGCLRCGYTMKPGETAHDTLRRMESERKLW